jgi:hypothetical protein
VYCPEGEAWAAIEFIPRKSSKASHGERGRLGPMALGKKLGLDVARVRNVEWGSAATKV